MTTMYAPVSPANARTMMVLVPVSNGTFAATYGPTLWQFP